MNKSFTAFNTRILCKQQIILLTGLLALSVLPHFWHLTIPISLFFSVTLLIRIIAEFYAKKTLSRWLTIALLMFGLSVVVAQYSGAVGKDFGVSLLVVTLGLKVLEIKTYRDAYVLLFLTCFMLVTQFLYNQEILFSLYIFILAFFVLSFLPWLNQAAHIKADFPIYLKTVGTLSLQSIPVMIILFIFFPRLHGPLWGLKTEGASAVTGISGNISPGSISQLSKSSATAFRVKFDQPDNLPDAKLRYWRGPVITDTDGINWNADESPEPAEIKFQAINSPVHYQLTLEPSQQHWIFSLDMPATAPPGTFITAGYSLRSNKKISQRSTYSQTSYPDYVANIDSRHQLNTALKLPDNITQRMRDLVAEFKRDTDSEVAFIAAVLKFFNTENFIYTLAPPLMASNPADEFLFETRKGFCGHYATSFVLIMRLANIPARVVAGYQGGEWNPAGDHLIVRQSDAHAWAEVWLEEKGWLRIDPTAAVAPERIENSIDPDTFQEGAPVIFKVSSGSMLGNMYKQVAWIADSLDLNWHRWVVGFSQTRQRDFLTSAGLEFLKNYKSLAFITVILAMIFIIVLALLVSRKPVVRKEPAKIYWDRFCKKLNNKGVNCHVTDGPETIADKAEKYLPDKAVTIRLISDLYINIRYSRKGDGKRLKMLRKLIAHFN